MCTACGSRDTGLGGSAASPTLEAGGAPAESAGCEAAALSLAKNPFALPLLRTRCMPADALADVLGGADDGLEDGCGGGGPCAGEGSMMSPNTCLKPVMSLLVVDGAHACRAAAGTHAVKGLLPLPLASKGASSSQPASVCALLCVPRLWLPRSWQTQAARLCTVLHILCTAQPTSSCHVSVLDENRSLDQPSTDSSRPT